MALGKTSGGRKNTTDFFVSIIIRTLIKLTLLLPYKMRVPFSGWVIASLVSPLVGYSNRIRKNLRYVCPDLSSQEVERLVKAVPNNSGRTLIEIFSGEAFMTRAENSEITGPGFVELENAKKQGRPVILVTGHFGNYDAPRAALTKKGFKVGVSMGSKMY